VTSMILSTGVCSALNLSGGQLQKIESIPFSERLPKAHRRKIGRLSLLMHAAVSDALSGFPGFANDSFPLVVGTAFGEIGTGIEVLNDIYDTAGALLRPVQVQNSVHVSSSGYLGILFGTHGPTLTVSQGKLTAEASLDALNTLMESTDATQGLVVVGDLFDPTWESLLPAGSSQREQLGRSLFYEGAAAMILGRDPREGSDSGWSISGVTLRLPEAEQPDSLALRSYLQKIPDAVELYTRSYAQWTATPVLPGDRHIPCTVVGSGLGTSMTGPLEFLRERMKATSAECLLFLSREDDELGVIRCDRCRIV
jgi:hypothetical protein